MLQDKFVKLRSGAYVYIGIYTYDKKALYKIPVYDMSGNVTIMDWADFRAGLNITHIIH